MAKREKLTTPAGEVKWAVLSKPNTKWKEKGEYSILLCLPDDHPYWETLKGMVEVGFEETKKTLKPKDRAAAKMVLPFTAEYDAETEEPTGRNEIRIKTAATFTDKKTGQEISLKPKLFDAKGKRIMADITVGNGSVCAINFSPAIYHRQIDNAIGMTLYLNAVQVIKLVEYEGDGSAFGFGAQEDGFDASNLPTGEPSDSDATEGDF